MSVTLHYNIIFRILRGSFPKFFNVITNGRLINRLSSDIYTVDSDLPYSIDRFTSAFFSFFATLIIFVILKSWIFQPVIVIYALYCFWIGYYYLKCVTEVYRLSAISQSPILAFFTETIRGAVYNRICVNEDFNRTKLQNKIDLNIRNKIASQSLYCHFIARVIYGDFYSMAILLVLCYFIDFANTNQTLYMLSMANSVTMVIMDLVFSFTNAYYYMVNFERCYALSNEIITEDEGVQEPL